MPAAERQMQIAGLINICQNFLNQNADLAMRVPKHQFVIFFIV